MEDIGKELCERVRAALEERNSRNAFMVRLKKEIAEGRATMRDTSLYSQTLGINLRRAIKEVVTPDELPDSTLYYNIAHSILEPLLRDTYEDVNAVCAEVQRKLDDKAGIHLAPQKADFPAERVRAACGSASTRDTPAHGIEVLERTSENITAAFSDDYMKANADFRSRAGLDTYIERRDDGKCCEWCSKIAGRYSYPDGAPRDVFRRHDNCGCTVECVSSRGRQNVWSKKWVSEPKKIEYSKPTVLTKEQAAELEKRLKLEKELTHGSKDGKIRLGINLFDPSSELYVEAFSIEEESGFIDIYLHGSPSSVQIMVNGKPKNLTPQEFVDILKSKGYKGGDIRLCSCSTGYGDNSFAQQVSQIIGSKVKAPDSDVYYAPNEGTVFVGDPNANVGKWRLFEKGVEIND